MDLLVHQYRVGSVSPCLVQIDREGGALIGGDIESVEQLFELRLAQYSSYSVTEREDFFVST